MENRAEINGIISVEDQLLEENKRLNAENYHLKRQLLNKGKKEKDLKRVIRRQKEIIDKHNDNRKPKFKNGKRGTFKNG